VPLGEDSVPSIMLRQKTIPRERADPFNGCRGRLRDSGEPGGGSIVPQWVGVYPHAFKDLHEESLEERRNMDK